MSLFFVFLQILIFKLAFNCLKISFEVSSRQVDGRLAFLLLSSVFAEFYFEKNKEIHATRINPFHAIGLFLYPLKTSETPRFSGNFIEHRKRLVI